MNKSDYTKLLEQPETLTESSIEGIKSVIDQYPYFQSARALYLKALKNKDSFKYNNTLKRTAAYTTDRSILFDYITSDVFNQNAVSDNIKQNSEYLKTLELSEIDDISVNKSVLIDEALKSHIQNTEGVLDPELFKKKESDESATVDMKLEDSVHAPILEIDVENITAEEQLEIGKPLDFDKNETHSFAEWLKITDFKPIEREEQPSDQVTQTKEEAPIKSKLDLIDKFIADNPKISPVDQVKPTTEASGVWSDEGLMTETLARIYLEQKNYEKAIQSYKILSLKYPEKSSFFANQIKAVEELKSQNK